LVLANRNIYGELYGQCRKEQPAKADSRTHPTLISHTVQVYCHKNNLGK